MKLLTKEIEKKLKANFLSTRKAVETGKPEPDHKPVVKLFTPWGANTWLITEMDNEDNDTLFGLCDLGMGEPELGYVSLSELKSLRGMFGLKVERDLYATFDKSLSEYTKEARQEQRIAA